MINAEFAATLRVAYVPAVKRAGLLILAVALASCRSVDNYRRLLPKAEVSDAVPYVADGNPRHALDLFSPKKEGPHAVVLFVHGGYWHAQDRQYLRGVVGLYSNVGVALAARDVVAVITSYRLFPETTIAGQVDDVIGALKWTVAHAAEHGGDPRRIVLAGHSAGAHLVMTLATRPDLLKAAGIDPSSVRGVVALSGVYDVPGLIGRGDRDIIDGVVIPHFTGDPKGWSPLERMDASLPPTYFVVGEKDYDSCLLDFQLAHHKLRGTKARAAFTMLEGRTHADVVLEIGGHRDEITPRIVRFVDAVTR